MDLVYTSSTAGVLLPPVFLYVHEVENFSILYMGSMFYSFSWFYELCIGEKFRGVEICIFILRSFY